MRQTSEIHQTTLVPNVQHSATFLRMQENSYINAPIYRSIEGEGNDKALAAEHLKCFNNVES